MIYADDNPPPLRLSVPCKLLIGEDRNGKPKFHKGTFYASDQDVMNFLLTMAGCPLGNLVTMREKDIFWPNFSVN